MAKTSGMGSQLWVSGYDLGGDTAAINSIHGGPAPLDFTDITKSAFERKGGLRDGGMNVTSFFNPSAGQAHPVYSALPTGDVVQTWSLSSTIGAPSASIVAKQIGYDGDRAQDGQFLLTVDGQANGYGLIWCFLATAGKRTDSAATAAAAVTALDLGSATPGAFGLSMFVHLFAFTGTSVTIKLQESSDNGADAYTDVVGATTAALSSAPTAVRIQTGAINVERYLKVVTTGTFSNAIFGVSVERHRTQTDF